MIAFKKLDKRIIDMVSVTTLLVVILILMPSCNGEKILLASLQMGSHLQEIARIGEGLVERGHEMYIICGEHHPLKGQLLRKPGFNVLTFFVPREEPTLASDTFSEHLRDVAFRGSLLEVRHIPALVSSLANEDCKHLMKDKNLLHELRETGLKFAVIDGFPGSPCMSIIALYLNIPFAVETGAYDFSSLTTSSVIPSVTPFFLTPTFSQHLNFRERFLNFFWHSYHVFMCESRGTGLKDTFLLQEYAPYTLTWNEALRKAELFITTRDYLLEWPQPLLPNVLSAPGLGGEPGNNLEGHPQLQSIMESSDEHGVILVSFGSAVGVLSDEVLQIFLLAFAQLPQTILLRHSNPVHCYVPRNVHMAKSWLPQNDVLAHNNTVLFITHCGNNGQYESLYHGVPMVGIPLFGDQFHNCHRAAAHGYGIDLEGIHRFSSEELVSAIHEVIRNPVFRNCTRKASVIMKKDETGPKQKIALAIETVMEVGGGHLRSSAYDLHWMQYLRLDVIASLIVLILILVGVGLFLIWWIVRMICSLCNHSSHLKSE